MKELTKKHYEEGENEIVISRFISAPRERVWQAMTNPNEVAQWWGPIGFTTKVESMDFKVGGVWKLMMIGPDGTEYPNKSIFQEIVKPERVVYKHGGGEKGGKGHSFTARWLFDETEDPNVTQLTIHMIFPTVEDRDLVIKGYNARQGGAETLGRLEKTLTAQPLVIERTFNASKTRLWNALTNNEEMKQWYFKLPEFKAEVGFEFQFNAGKDCTKYLHLCRVTQVVPESKIAYTWRYDGNEGDSEVSFELFEEGGKTRLKVTHKNIHTFPASNPDFDQRNFRFGWTSILNDSLQNYIETSSVKK